MKNAEKIWLFFGGLIAIFGIGIYYAYTEEEAEFQTLCGGQSCNIILIVSDTLGAKHMNIYGYELKTTPFINQYFGESSMVYTHAYSPAPWTLPSFASFMRGRYASEITIGELGTTTRTLPSYLRNNGVSVASVLKKPTIEPQQKPHLILETIDILFEENEVFARVPYQSHEETFRAANSWLSEVGSNVDGNFFLFVHDTTPHNPYAAPPKYADLFGSTGFVEHTLEDLRVEYGKKSKYSDYEWNQLRIQYDQDVLYFDNLLQGFIKDIPNELQDNTIVIVTSDHGEAFGEHNTSFHGNSVYREQIHVPLLIKAPGIEQRVVSDAVSLIDLTPTILSWMNIDYDKSRFTGQVLPISNNNSERKTLVRAERVTFPLSKSIRKVTFRDTDIGEAVDEALFAEKVSGQVTAVSLQDNRYKVIGRLDEIQGVRHEMYEVYAYRTDPNEQKNLYTIKQGSENNAYAYLIQEARRMLR